MLVNDIILYVQFSKDVFFGGDGGGIDEGGGNFENSIEGVFNMSDIDIINYIVLLVIGDDYVFFLIFIGIFFMSLVLFIFRRK